MSVFGYAFAGALQGAGQGLKDQAIAKREKGLELVRQNFQLGRDEANRSFARSERLADQEFKRELASAKASNPDWELKEIYNENGQKQKVWMNQKTGDYENVGGPAAPGGTSLTVDADGNVTFNQGGAVQSGRSTKKLSDELSKADVAMLKGARETAQTSEDLLSVANQMEAVIDKVGYTGPGGELYGKVDDMVGVLPGESGPRGAMRSLGMEAQLTFTEKTKGAITDREMAMFKSAVPGLTQTYEGNQEIIKTIRAGAQRVQQRADYYERFIQQNGSLQGAQAQWNRYMKAHPIIVEGDNGLKLVESADVSPFLDPSYRPPEASDRSMSSRSPDRPMQGTIEDGYRFKGGDPADQSSWEKVR